MNRIVPPELTPNAIGFGLVVAVGGFTFAVVYLESDPIPLFTGFVLSIIFGLGFYQIQQVGGESDR